MLVVALLPLLKKNQKLKCLKFETEELGLEVFHLTNEKQEQPCDVNESRKVRDTLEETIKMEGLSFWMSRKIITTSTNINIVAQLDNYLRDYPRFALH